MTFEVDDKVIVTSKFVFFCGASGTVVGKIKGSGPTVNVRLISNGFDLVPKNGEYWFYSDVLTKKEP